MWGLGEVGGTPQFQPGLCPCPFPLEAVTWPWHSVSQEGGVCIFPSVGARNQKPSLALSAERKPRVSVLLIPPAASHAETELSETG